MVAWWWYVRLEWCCHLPQQSILRSTCHWMQPQLGAVCHLQVSLSPLASQQKGLESPLLVRRFLVISQKPLWTHIYRKGNLWGGFWAVCRNVGRDTAGPQVRPGTGTLWMGREALPFSLASPSPSFSQHRPVSSAPRSRRQTWLPTHRFFIFWSKCLDRDYFLCVPENSGLLRGTAEWF